MGTSNRIPLGILLVILAPLNALYHNNKVCSTWGNFQFKNFDGDIFYFPGTCNYLFASDCKSTYENFNIQMRRTVVNNVPVIENISMKLNGLIAQISRNVVSVNDESIQLPFSGSGIQIEKNGLYLRVTSKLGLVFMWNDDDSLLLELESKYANTTCGLCGDFNGISIYNEFIANGIQMTAAQFGNQQKLDGPTEQCDDVQPTSKSNCSDYESICASTLFSSSFSSCHDLVAVQQYIEACVQDLCQCEGNDSILCLCNTFAEYSRQCAHAGGNPNNWRRTDLCLKTCPNNMVYKECGSPCLDSCSNPEREALCENHCMEGCFCPPGTVFDDINKSGCVPHETCSCTFNNNIYAPGTSYSTPCSKCTCSGGKWSCKNLPCPASCSIEGGSHITTYDQTQYNVHGDCNYVLSKACDSESFIVLAEMRKCGLTESETCLKSTTIILNGRETIIEIKPCGSVFVNSINTQLPVSAANVTIFRPSSFYIIVHINLGVQIVAQLTPFMQVYVALDPAYKGLTCGLCGNFNDKQSDDFQTISGVIEGTAASFANTWKTQGACSNVKNVYEDPCSLSVDNEKYAQHWCGLISDPNGPFAACHATVNPAVYKQNCMFDTCNCEKSEECMCASLSSYVHACAAKGIELTGWRENVCTKYMNTCPKSLSYTYSTSTCQPTCRSLSVPDITCNIPFLPVDGCTCADGFYMDDSGICVSAAACPCYYKGSAVASGEAVHDNGIMCTCAQGLLTCIGNVNPVCNSPMVYFDCKNATVGTKGSECHKSCQTLDMACYSAECVSGCVCPDDLVADGKGGCIKEDDCPCIHNDATYQPGEQIKMKCNNCTCQNRMWQCTDNPCLASCVVYGDGHYITFDGKRYSFSGDCEYVLAQDHCGQDENSSTFRVITENIPCGTTGTTCSKSIKVFMKNYELILTEEDYEVVEKSIGGVVPYKIRHMGIYLVIEADNGLILMWDRKTSIFIKLIKGFEGKVCGLCGNYDGDGNNDFTTRSQSVVGDITEFGNSWKIAQSCPDANVVKDACSANPYRKSWAQKQCSIINSAVFSACHAQVDPSKYYDACVTDACACDSGGDCECFCTAVAAYAQACGEAGICVSWRTPSICPLFCDYYNPEGECEWHYKPCGTPCLKTCRNPSGKCLHEFTGLEGCYPSCPDNKPLFDEDEMECVAQCGCYDGKENHYRVGKTVPSDKNCQQCICSPTGVECKFQEEACYCEYQGERYDYNDVIYNTTDGIGGCITAICKENGTVYRDIFDCPGTSTTPFTFSTTHPTITSGTTTPSTPICVKEECNWSQWIDVSYPEFGMENGDFETYENITAKDRSICNHPQDIECRAERFPNKTLSELKQNVKCDVSFGLICLNKDQRPPICYNYEIRVKCCSLSPTISTTAGTTTIPTTTETISTTTGTTTIPTTTETISTTTETTTIPTTTETISTTTETTTITPSTHICVKEECNWSQWFDYSYPEFGMENGDFETYENITAKDRSICNHPQDIECRAERFPNKTLSELKQNVKCDVSFGLICLNKDQRPPICYNYEIRVKCCSLSPCVVETTTSSITSTETLTTIITNSTTTQPTTFSIFTTTETTTIPTTTETISTTTETTTIPTTTETISTRTVTTTIPTTTETISTTTETTTIPTTTETISTTTGTTTIPTTTETISTTTGTTTIPTTTETISTRTVTTTIPTTTETISTTTETTTIPTTTETISTTGITTIPTTTETISTTTGTTTIPTTTETISTTTETTTIPTTTETISTTTETTTIPTTTETISTTTGTTTIPTTTETISTTTGTTTIPTTTETISTTTETISTTTETTTVPTTTETISTTTETTSITPSTHICVKEACNWSQWIDVSYPEFGMENGDFETYENITAKERSICNHPQDIECRAERFPNKTLSELKQNVKCDVSFGLICLNKDQRPPICYNYEIRVKCCSLSPCVVETTTSSITSTETLTTIITNSTTTQPTTFSISTTTETTTIPTTTETISTTTETTTIPTTTETISTTTETTTIPTTTETISTTTETTTIPTTTETISTTTETTSITPSTHICVKEACNWSQWIDVSYPEFGMENGDFETYENITAKDRSICNHPQDIECRAERFPNKTLSELKQNVKCDVSFGLICLNKNQRPPICYNYEIRVKCCSLSPCVVETTTSSITSTETLTTIITNSTTTQPTTFSISTTTETTTIPTTTETISTTTETTTIPTTTGTISTTTETTTIPTTTETISTTTETTTIPTTTETISTTTGTTTIPTTTETISTTTGTTTIPTTTETISTTTETISTTTETTTVPTTTETISTTTETTSITPSTHICVKEACNWSQWIDVSYPEFGMENGDFETYENITAKERSICNHPQDIECRAERFPNKTLSELKQNVKCDVSFGLICLNKDQRPPVCYNYEIRVKCCSLSPCVVETTTSSITSTETLITNSTTTQPTTFSISTTTETTTIPTTTETISTTTETTTIPTTTETISTTETTTIPTTTETTSTTTETTTIPTTIETTISTTESTTSRTTTASTSTPTTNCFCHVDYKLFSPRDIIYNKSDEAGCPFYAVCNDFCKVERFTGPCTKTTQTTLTTSTSETTTSPTTPRCTTCNKTTTPSKTTTIEGCPPRKTNETWINNNCEEVTCHGNNVTTHNPVICPKVKPITCANGYPPIKKKSADGCCDYLECQCVCSGWGDPHYITFDGVYYTFLDNCTYVLVQQITPKYDNFRILVDNVFCEAHDRLSCPQSILIYYKSNEIVLTQMNNRIRFNNDWITPGFTKNNITITSAGININVEISEIDVSISFSGMIFEITLPFSKFAYNTEGQCGTCSNNSTEDCRIPSGKVVKDCSAMAPYWRVNTTTPGCSKQPPTPPPTPYYVITTPSTPQNVCDVILSDVFAECHKIIPPTPFYHGCYFDASRISNASVQCSSLEVYASVCNKYGICVNWREKTGGLCSYNCPAGKEYNPCGPVHVNTCETKYMESDGTRKTEGCFCPAGTMLFNSFTDTCVKSCACVGPDGMPKAPAETWTSDCKKCVCEKNSLTVQCEPLTCPTLTPITCEKEGYMPVTQPNPEQPCCMQNECRCKSSYCLYKEKKAFSTWMCKVNAVVNVYRSNPGETWSSSDDNCTYHKCTQYGDHFDIYIINKECAVHSEKDCLLGHRYEKAEGECCGKCVQVFCALILEDNSTQIVQGYMYETTPEECCGHCVKVACIMELSDNSTQLLKPGEVYVPPEDKCVSYKCTSTLELKEVTKRCPAFNPENCLKGTIRSTEDGCCKKCDSIISGCQAHNQSVIIKSGTCESDQFVELSNCGGGCMTSSIYSADSNTMEHACSCCQEVKTSERKVNLKCQNGTSTVYTYLYAEECGCATTKCDKTSISQQEQKTDDQNQHHQKNN
ncbi:LOW QUALITY PROTEIN: mucin-5AC-like [Mantella aurantiaca]